MDDVKTENKDDVSAIQNADVPEKNPWFEVRMQDQPNGKHGWGL